MVVAQVVEVMAATAAIVAPTMELVVACLHPAQPLPVLVPLVPWCY